MLLSSAVQNIESFNQIEETIQLNNLENEKNDILSQDTSESKISQLSLNSDNVGLQILNC